MNNIPNEETKAAMLEADAMSKDGSSPWQQPEDAPVHEHRIEASEKEVDILERMERELIEVFGGENVKVLRIGDADQPEDVKGPSQETRERVAKDSHLVCDYFETHDDHNRTIELYSFSRDVHQQVHDFHSGQPMPLLTSFDLIQDIAKEYTEKTGYETCLMKITIEKVEAPE